MRASPAPGGSNATSSQRITSGPPLAWMRTAFVIARTTQASLGDTGGEFLVFEHGDRRRRPAQPQLLPPRHHVLVRLLGELGALGERLDEAIVHAGIDQTLRSPW